MPAEGSDEYQEATVAIADGATPPEPAIVHRTVAERVARGKAARGSAPRADQSTIEVDPDRDPVAILEGQALTRVPALVPIRHGRMLTSPLAFFRGAAAVMAHDLASTSSAGLRAQISGDAHLLNFGGYASPERALVFDLNDFDETLAGPFEWDVKRLAASFEVAARHRDFRSIDRERAVIAAVGAYRQAIRGFATMGDLDVWYARLDAQSIIREIRAAHDKKSARIVRRSTLKARSNDGRRELAKLTRILDGQPRIISDPPLLVPIAELAGSGDEPFDLEANIRTLFRLYRRSLPHDRRVLLERFRIVDLARKVVGVGSVGTRCWVLLMQGLDDGDPLFLQIKQAESSVLEAALGGSPFGNHAQRVVEGQRLMQASSDIFLGWVRDTSSADGSAFDFYVRQLRDWKVTVDIESILPRGLTLYARACGWTLARAHARSGDRVAIASYLGRGDRFDHALRRFASDYADLNESDHRAFARAVAAGRLTAIEGI
jgi:uncharacterized protein (DUF2252 family)